jgi:hypothetical protein
MDSCLDLIILRLKNITTRQPFDISNLRLPLPAKYEGDRAGPFGLVDYCLSISILSGDTWKVMEGCQVPSSRL